MAKKRRLIDRPNWYEDGKGKKIRTKPSTQKYREGWEKVFGKVEAETNK